VYHFFQVLISYKKKSSPGVAFFQCTSSTHYEIFMHFWFSFEKQASEFPLLENLPGMSAYIQRS